MSCVEVALCLGCARPEEKAVTLLAEASHLVHAAHDVQQTKSNHTTFVHSYGNR
jgi:hypothetical protein